MKNCWCRCSLRRHYYPRRSKNGFCIYDESFIPGSRLLWCIEEMRWIVDFKSTFTSLDFLVWIGRKPAQKLHQGISQQAVLKLLYCEQEIWYWKSVFSLQKSFTRHYAGEVTQEKKPLWTTIKPQREQVCGFRKATHCFDFLQVIIILLMPVCN